MHSSSFHHPFEVIRTFGFASRLTVVCALGYLFCIDVNAQDPLPAAARAQIESLLVEKAARKPSARKVDSQLLYRVKENQNEPVTLQVKSLQTLLSVSESRVLVDIRGNITPALESSIRDGGVIVRSVPRLGALRARIPFAMIPRLSGRDEVRFIEPAVRASTSSEPIVTEGDRTHQADAAKKAFATNNGKGVKIGVLSDGVDSLEVSKKDGNLNASARALPGEAGAGDEGTAMMEIIQDIVPEAEICFATGTLSPASMAENIRALAKNGCSIIVDDVTYSNESPFQDQLIAQAVNEVCRNGVMYFSSARNSGNLARRTSGTWEGNFVDGGEAKIGANKGRLHSFGGTWQNRVKSVDDHPAHRRVDLFWSDPLENSKNDYDLFVVTSGGTVLRSSTNVQDGTIDPYEWVGSLNAGERIVIVKSESAEPRFLHLDTGRSSLSIATQGSVRGHNASVAANAFCIAATNVANSPSPKFFVGGTINPVEAYSSDGPRLVFFSEKGVALNPGKYLADGGQIHNKPDFTAAAGGSTSVKGFETFPGTSAAAPHAAAIAALLKSYNSALTPAQIRAIFRASALDIETPGWDRTSGHGIIMALAALQNAPPPAQSLPGAPGPSATPIEAPSSP